MDLSTDATMEMVFVLKLNEDGTYTLNVDRDALKTSLQTYIDALIPVAVEMIYQQLEDQGMNRADIDEAMAARGRHRGGICAADDGRLDRRGPDDGRPGG